MEVVVTKLRMWTVEPPHADVQVSLERLAHQPGVVGIAAMPDVHLAHDVCVGTVLATEGTIYPAAIGDDIGCGISTIRFDGEARAVADRADAVMRGLKSIIPVIRHRQPRGLPDALNSDDISPSLRKVSRRDGSFQFGTIGRGNHFLELQSDKEGALWLTVHSGSRAIGPYVQRLHGHGSKSLFAIPAESDQAGQFLQDHNWALEYARLSREEMTTVAGALIMRLFGFRPAAGTHIDCAHNMVLRQAVDGDELWVHRKGAISAESHELGIIPGSMGAPTFLVEGRGHAPAFNSSSHGAGRKLSRTEARKKISVRQLRQQTREVTINNAAETKLVEEAPGAYKDIRSVMRAQRQLTKVIGELRPVINYKGA